METNETNNNEINSNEINNNEINSNEINSNEINSNEINSNEIEIDFLHASQRFDKFLLKRFPKAKKSLVYKLLREKRIKLNGSRASGNETLQIGDKVKFYISPKTIADLSEKSELQISGSISIIYEDENILVCDKPVNLLTQPDKPNCDCLINRAIFYLQNQNIDFIPGCINRLDRNTSGVVVIAKNLPTAQMLSEQVRMRNCEKFYVAVVVGKASRMTLTGKLQKDFKTNIVAVTEHGQESVTIVEPLRNGVNAISEFTVLKINLVTGRTHQIRVHLSNAGFPIVGDPKYGDNKINHKYKAIGIDSQLLYAQSISFPKCTGFLEYLSDMTFLSPTPTMFSNFI